MFVIIYMSLINRQAYKMTWYIRKTTKSINHVFKFIAYHWPFHYHFKWWHASFISYRASCQYKSRLFRYRDFIINIRRSCGHRIFIVWIPIPVKHRYIGTASRWPVHSKKCEAINYPNIVIYNMNYFFSIQFGTFLMNYFAPKLSLKCRHSSIKWWTNTDSDGTIGVVQSCMLMDR